MPHRKENGHSQVIITSSCSPTWLAARGRKCGRRQVMSGTTGNGVGISHLWQGNYVKGLTYRMLLYNLVSPNKRAVHKWGLNAFSSILSTFWVYQSFLFLIYRAFQKKRYNVWVSLSRLNRWFESLDHILLNTVIHSFVLNIDNFQWNIWKPRYWSPKFDN